jgi:hypothetical protein
MVSTFRPELKVCFATVCSPDKSMANGLFWVVGRHSLTHARQPALRVKESSLEVADDDDHPVTNADTESVNNQAKGLNWIGLGYSFEVIRVCRIYDRDARRDMRETLRKNVRGAAPRRCATSSLILPGVRRQRNTAPQISPGCPSPPPFERWSENWTPVPSIEHVDHRAADDRPQSGARPTPHPDH